MTARMSRNLITSLIVGLLLVLILVVTSGCTIYKVKAPLADGRQVSALIIYPPGKKVNLSKLEFGEFKLGSADTEQPGAEAYTQSMFQMMQMMQMMYGLTPIRQPASATITPLQLPEGEDP